jgi:hypothetical protein
MPPPGSLNVSMNSDVENPVAQSVQRLGYGLDDRGGDFSLRQHVHTGSRTHPASYLMCTAGKTAGA